MNEAGIVADVPREIRAGPTRGTAMHGIMTAAIVGLAACGSQAGQVAQATGTTAGVQNEANSSQPRVKSGTGFGVRSGGGVRARAPRRFALGMPKLFFGQRFQLGGVRSKGPRGIGKVPTLLPAPAPAPSGGGVSGGVQGPIVVVPGLDGRGVVSGRGRGDRLPSADTGRRYFPGGGTGPGLDVTYSDGPWTIRGLIGTPLYAGSWSRGYGYGRGLGYGTLGCRSIDSWGPVWWGSDRLLGGWEGAGTGVVDPFVARGSPAKPDATDALQAPQRVLSPMEQAGAELAEGDAAAAVVLLRRHVEQNSDDGVAARLLGVALLDAGRPQEAVAVIAQAYERSPALADTPLDPQSVGGARALRELVLDAVRYAHRVDSASAWLSVSVLMQGEGRTDVAARMLERAEGQRLNDEVAAALRLALVVR